MWRAAVWRSGQGSGGQQCGGAVRALEGSSVEERSGLWRAAVWRSGQGSGLLTGGSWVQSQVGGHCCCTFEQVGWVLCRIPARQTFRAVRAANLRVKDGANPSLQRHLVDVRDNLKKKKETTIPSQHGRN
ncbi:UNVERIFIED_CONTAM: hypothetical protein FKN15_035642 [Acipenser sinensis]